MYTGSTHVVSCNQAVTILYLISIDHSYDYPTALRILEIFNANEMDEVAECRYTTHISNPHLNSARLARLAAAVLAAALLDGWTGLGVVLGFFGQSPNPLPITQSKCHRVHGCV